MIANHKQLIDAELEGRVRRYTWRKAPTQTTSAARWFDLSMSPGNPPPKYWFDATPGVAKAVYQSTDWGIFHGANVSPSTKYIRLISGFATASTALPMPMILCDYLLYYPSIDDSITDVQELDNSVTLPRYTDGNGVMILPVTVAARTGGQQFYVTYTNQDGVSGRVSRTVQQDTASAIGSITTSIINVLNCGGPFIPLQTGDTGVRSIESVTMLGPDVGLFSLILVRPLVTFQLRSIGAFNEKDVYLTTGTLPIVQDNAFLNFVCNAQGTLAATVLMGDLKVIWD